MEASTNLIGGQPFSVQNLRDVRALADKYASGWCWIVVCWAKNAYLVLQREPEFKDSNMETVIKTMTGLADLCYFSARKLSLSRGGGICTDSMEIFKELRSFYPFVK